MKNVDTLDTARDFYLQVIASCDRLIICEGTDFDRFLEVKKKCLCRRSMPELLKLRDEYQSKLNRLKTSHRLDEYNHEYKRKGKGLEVNWYDLYNQRDPLLRVPADCVCTMAIDTQDDRFEVGIEYWDKKTGANFKVEYEQIHGDLEKPLVWKQLAIKIKSFKPLVCFIDSGGHFTKEVYRFCKSFPNVYPIKGEDHGPVIIGRGANGIVRIGTHKAKEELYTRLNKKDRIHFANFSESYFKQLASEKQLTTYRHGKRRTIWVKLRERNEALDLSVYNLAAYYFAKFYMDK